jgi:hypothetical protein
MAHKVVLHQPPTVVKDFEDRIWTDWFNSIFTRVGQGPFMLQGYDKDGLPDATKFGSETDPFSSLIFVSDDVGGSTIAFSDGTNWRRMQDREIIS